MLENEKLCYLEFDDYLIKKSYTAYLERILAYYSFTDDEFGFDSMIELNTELVSDIKEKIRDIEQFEPNYHNESFENIIEAYEEIHEILARYLEY